MRRITFALISTLAALVLLLSYRTSSGDGGTTAATVVSPARIVAQAPMSTASSGPDPRSDTGGTNPAANRTSVSARTAAPHTSASHTTAPTTTATTTTAPRVSAPSSSTVTRTSTSAPSATAAAQVTVQGSTEMTQYGAVQVQLTVAGNVITDVTAVAYPNESGRDQEINAMAVPALQNQVLKAQSAHVQGVSGATYTTEGFLTSVQSALDAVGFHS